MKVSRTEYMCVNKKNSGMVKMQEVDVVKVKKFKYLGSRIQSNRVCKKLKKKEQA